MFSRLILLLGTFWLCCSQLAIADDDDFRLGSITDGNITVNLGEVFKGYVCDSPSNSSLFGATICLRTPNIDDKVFSEDLNKDFGIYNTNKAEDLLNQFKQEELENRYGKDGSKLKDKYEKEHPGQKIDNLYNRDTSTGVFRLNFRGLPIIASFPYSMEETGKDGRTLAFSVPSLNINKIFVGTDREDSVEQLKNYLKKDANAILKNLTEISPGDPVVLAQEDIVRNEFNIGLKDLLGIGFGYGEDTYGTDKHKYFNLPLSKSIPLGANQELIFRLPLRYTEVNGEAKVGQAIGGVSYKTPIPNTDNRWFLMPSFSYGVVFSKDVASVAQIVSTSLTSEFLLVEHPNYSVSIGNLIGYSRTLPFKYKDWVLTAERTNIFTRNGILLSVPFSSLTNQKVLGIELVAELFVIDTRAFGDPMYENQFSEIGFTIGPKKEKITPKKADEESFVNVSRQEISLGFRYTPSSDGVEFSMGYQF